MGLLLRDMGEPEGNLCQYYPVDELCSVYHITTTKDLHTDTDPTHNRRRAKALKRQLVIRETDDSQHEQHDNVT